MNIDFSAQPGFSAYVLLLMASGLTMVVLASPAVRGSSMSARILNVVVGVGFFGYGFYLAFLFGGGSYFIFFKAFLLPALLIVRTLGAALRGRNRPQPAPAAQPATVYPPGVPVPPAAEPNRPPRY